MRRLQITFGERNSIKRFYRKFKEGTKRFNNINARRNKIASPSVFLSLFSLLYDHMGWHQGMRRVPGGELAI